MNATTDDNDTVTAFEPDRTLRDLIGDDVNLAEIFTPEKIAAGQKTVDDSCHAFFEQALTQMAQLESVLAKNPRLPENERAVFEDIAACAADIKGHAEMCGFTLPLTIGNCILDCCEAGERTPAARYLLIADLAKMLRVTLTEKLMDEKGSLGRELRASLNQY